MKKKLSNIAGLTLIEILIAIVISSLMMAAMFTSYTIVNSTYRQVTDRAKISQSGRDLVGQILREVRICFVGPKSTKGCWGPGAPEY